MNKRMRGFTLIELVATVAIVAIIATAAVPMIADYNVNSRLREAGNALLADTLYAQGQAIYRNSNVTLMVGSTMVQVRDTESGQVLRQRELPASLHATYADITFGAAGRPTPLGVSANIDLSMTDKTCSSQYRCPRVAIEGGGTVRLHGNKLEVSP